MQNHIVPAVRQFVAMTAGAALTMFVLSASAQAADGEDAAIRPWPDNPRYWQYKGPPVLLLGGTDDDNLFQWDAAALEAQLDRLVAAGGNVARNTMSSRDDGNAQPFAKGDDGRYDLDRWNPEYWERFERFLKMTAERDVIVQIEFFDPWDTYAAQWESNPWNPKNNATYTTADTHLEEAYAAPRYSGGTSTGRPHDFFLTPPGLNDDGPVRTRQQRFVEQVLDWSLPYPNVLYCVTNEIHPQYPPEWGWHWARFVRERAAAAGRRVYVSEMYWTLEFDHVQHQASLDHPEIYDFFEASQNSAMRDGDGAWKNLQYARQRLSEAPRPINHTKIYGADGGPAWADSTSAAEAFFWRGLIGGAASVRFHRPPTGLGLNDVAVRNLRSARMLSEAFDFLRATPDSDHGLLRDRGAAEAYCAAVSGRQYAVYFPNGGAVGLDMSGAEGAWTVRWLNIAGSQWSEAMPVEGGATAPLTAPGDGQWVALVQAR